MGWPLLLMSLGFISFFGAVVLIRTRGELLSRERRTKWVKAIIEMEKK
jgi:heme exporter protein C